MSYDQKHRQTGRSTRGILFALSETDHHERVYYVSHNMAASRHHHLMATGLDEKRAGKVNFISRYNPSLHYPTGMIRGAEARVHFVHFMPYDPALYR